jgi:hypothetical protein
MKKVKAKRFLKKTFQTKLKEKNYTKKTEKVFEKKKTRK